MLAFGLDLAIRIEAHEIHAISTAASRLIIDFKEDICTTEKRPLLHEPQFRGTALCASTLSRSEGLLTYLFPFFLCLASLGVFSRRSSLSEFWHILQVFKHNLS